MELSSRFWVHGQPLPEVLRVNGERFDGLHRPRIELPAEGGGHPAEPDDVTRFDGVDNDGPQRRRVDLNGHPASGDEEDGAGILALPKEQGTRIETHDPRRLRQERKRPARNSGQKFVLAQKLVRRPILADHDSFIIWLIVSMTDAPSVARMAAASSVMSMPTGHHAMHLPHPTQPDSSN